jgi:hypothetical protein
MLIIYIFKTSHILSRHIFNICFLYSSYYYYFVKDKISHILAVLNIYERSKRKGRVDGLNKQKHAAQLIFTLQLCVIGVVKNCTVCSFVWCYK